MTESETVPLKTGSSYGSLADSKKSSPGSARAKTRKTSPAINGKPPTHNRTTSQVSRTPSQTSHVLLKTQTSMLEDARAFAEGSIPHSIALGTVIGIVCGVAAYIYYAILFWVLKFVWETLPEKFVKDVWPEWAYPLWIPLVGFTMAFGVGVTVIYMGEPGDLPYTIKCVHDDAYVDMSHGMFVIIWIVFPSFQFVNFCRHSSNTRSNVRFLAFFQSHAHGRRFAIFHYWRRIVRS